MALEKVAAKTKEHPTPVEVEYDFGDDTLEGLVSKFGKDVVKSRAKSALVIDLQALMRREIEGKDFSLDGLKKKVAEWKPSVISGVRRSASEKLEDTVSNLTPEQQADLLAKLQAQLAANKGGKTASATAPQGGNKAGASGATRTR